MYPIVLCSPSFASPQGERLESGWLHDTTARNELSECPAPLTPAQACQFVGVDRGQLCHRPRASPYLVPLISCLAGPGEVGGSLMDAWVAEFLLC